MYLPRDAMGWSVIWGCVIHWPYSIVLEPFYHIKLGKKLPYSMLRIRFIHAENMLNIMLLIWLFPCDDALHKLGSLHAS